MSNEEKVRELRVRISEKMFAMLEQIMKEEGLVSLAETTRFLIREKYKEFLKKKFQE